MISQNTVLIFAWGVTATILVGLSLLTLINFVMGKVGDSKRMITGLPTSAPNAITKSTKDVLYHGKSGCLCGKKPTEKQ